VLAASAVIGTVYNTIKRQISVNPVKRSVMYCPNCVNNFLRDTSFGNRNIFIPVFDQASATNHFDNFCCFEINNRQTPLGIMVEPTLFNTVSQLRLSSLIIKLPQVKKCNFNT
jgi:hypothetical protein